MNVRAVHALVLNAVLAIAAAFYLTAPTVYAYFSEVTMTYARAPKWLVSTPAARATARMFDRYNEHAPWAERFNRQLTCFLTDAGATRKPGCMHELHDAQSAYGPPALKLPSGQYVVRFDFGGLERCAGGDARLDVVTTGRFGRVLADYTRRIVPGDQIELPFQLHLMDAALASVEFRVSGVTGCVLLTHAAWAQNQ